MASPDFRLLFECLPIGAAVIGPDLRLRAANRTLTRWLGQAEAALIGQSVSDLALGDAGAILRGGAAPPEAEFRIVDAAGQARWLSLSLTPLVPAGEADPLGGDRVLLLDDVTARRNAREAADQAQEARSRFLAAASHDLRQPLNALSLFLGVLKASTSHQRALEIADQMQVSLEILIELLNALLDLTRFESGGVALRRERISANELLRRLEQDFTPLAATKDVALRIVPCGEVLVSDFTLLERMLRNLVATALHNTESGRVLVGCRRAGGHLRFHIYDTGHGIPDAEIRGIFDDSDHPTNPFWRLADGRGLGLATVKRAAALLGHQVAVVSQPGCGSRFSLEVPLAETPAAANGARPLRPGGAAGQLPVLVIEDEPLVLAALQACLEDSGCLVLPASSGAEALEQLSQLSAPPRLIISDYRLPGEDDGLSTIVEVRRRLAAPIPACIMTGDLDEALRERASAQEIQVLYKPLKPDLLQRLIAGLP